MNAIDKGKGDVKTIIFGEAFKPVLYEALLYAIIDIQEILEQTANARVLEVLKGLVVRIKKDAEYTNPKDDLEKIGELARSTGALKAVHRLQDLMSELLDKG